MKAVIENGGLNLNLYNITRGRKETDYLFESKLSMAKRQIFLDLAFFNTLLEKIYLATDEDDLRDLMRVAFEERAFKNRNPNQLPFKYYFGKYGISTNSADTENMDYMEVYQVGNPNRLIFVEL